MKILKKNFYEHNTAHVARALLGKMLVRSWHGHLLAGIIVETEAYLGLADPASHAYKGETPRNKAMFGPAGHSYVYFIYGNHHCLNIVAKDKKSAAGGVLIRSIIPIAGIDVMKKLRKTDSITHLTDGPGKIGQAFHLTVADNHIDVTKRGPLFILDGIHLTSSDSIATPRIGISKAHEKLWRFIVTKEKIEQVKATNISVSSPVIME